MAGTTIAPSQPEDPSNVPNKRFFSQVGRITRNLQCWDEIDPGPVAGMARGLLTTTSGCYVASLAYNLQTRRLRLCTIHKSALATPAVLRERLFRAETHWANTRVRPDFSDQTVLLESGDRCCVNCPDVEAVVRSILLGHCAALEDDDFRDVIRE